MELNEQKIAKFRIAMNGLGWDGGDALCNAALAHLAAKERSVQGMAIVNSDGKVWHVEPDENEEYTWREASNSVAGMKTPDDLRRGGNTCQPCTITINAAGATVGKSLLRKEGEPLVCNCPPDKCQAPVVMGYQTKCLRAPAPAAPVARCDKCNRATWDAEHVGNLCGMTQPDQSRCSGLMKASAAPVSENAERWAVFCAGCNAEWSVPYHHPGKSICGSCEKLLTSALHSGITRAGERIGIRKGLEMAAKVCRKRAEKRFTEDGYTEDDTGASYYPSYCRERNETLDEEAQDCAIAITALLDAQKEGV